MPMTAKELLDQLRAAVAEFGSEAEVFRLPLDRDAGEVETGYWSDKMNPARGGKSPPLYFVADGQGIVGARYAKEDDHKPDVHVTSLIKSYSKRKRIIAETGTYPGASTDELTNDDPNAAIETPHDHD